MLFGCVISQNWEPIVIGKTLHYRSDTGQVIVESIHVDSVGIENGDSVYFLNRKIKTILSGQTATLNGERFLSKKMKKRSNGLRKFIDPFNFTLWIDAQTSASWVYDSLANVTAQIFQSDTLTVLGISDSVKTIALSTGDTLLLSKNFGFVRFTDISVSPPATYVLTGIIETQTGMQMPGFFDYFNFNAGDIFEFRGYGQGVSEYWTSSYKEYIDSVTIYTDSVVCYLRSLGTRSGFSPGPFTNTWNDTLRRLYIKNEYEVFTRLPGEALRQVTWFPQMTVLCDSNQYFSFRFYHDPLLGNIWSTLREDGNTEYFRNQPGNDTVAYHDMTGYFFGNSAEYTEGLGQIYSQTIVPEFGESWFLSAWRKNGDTTGTFTPDSVIISVAPGENQENNRVHLFPNPSTDEIQIQKTSSENINYQISDLYGRIVASGILENEITIIPIQQLPSGIYFLQALPSKSGAIRWIKN